MSEPFIQEALQRWVLDPVALAALASAAGWYGIGQLAHPPLRRARALAYYSGLLGVALALVGPPSALHDSLFTAHMTQHMLLIMVAPPLLVMGRPVAVLLAMLGPAPRRRLGRTLVRAGVARTLSNPMVALLVANGALVFWHVPALYGAALAIPGVHALEHATLFWGALLFWWVVLAPPPRPQAWSATTALLVLFTTWMVSDLLGAALTLSPSPLYGEYLGTTAEWGLAPLEDQRLGGALMWAGGGVLYAATMVGILVRTSRAGERRPGSTAWVESRERTQGRRDATVAG